MTRFLIAALVAASLTPTWSQAETIRIATWNIEHLRAENGVGSVKRDDADYAALRRYAGELNADIIALQEVDGTEAAARVFDPAEYDFFFSDRNNVQRTGFAVRRDIEVIDDTDFVDLALDGSVRRGTDIIIKVGDTELRFLAVHLKSGCFDDPITRDNNACNKLERQLPILEEWIDDRTVENIPFVVLGDFNRRFDTEDGGPDEVFFPQIDDGEPAPLDLIRLPPEEARSQCSGGAFPVYIDHIVLDEQAVAFVIEESFRQVIFSEQDEDDFKLSDHCPISVDLLVPDRAGEDAEARAEVLLEEIRALVSKTNEKLEELHRLMPQLRD